MQHYTLRQLEYFVACIDHGSIAGAAEALHVSQPTISVAIAKLEDQFAVQLLLRHHSQGVSPTTSAKNILPSARALLAHATDLQRQAMLAGSTVVGELKLGSFTTLAPVVLPELMKALADEFPSIKLQVQEGPQEMILNDLLAGELDVALLYDIELPRALRCVPLARPTPYVALPDGHPLADNAVVSLAELAQEPLILLDVSPSRDYFLGLFHSAGLKPNIARSSPSLELVRGLVGQGLGYSILVTRPSGDLSYDGQALAIRPLNDTVSSSAIVLASLANHRPTRLLTSLEEVAKRVISLNSSRPPSV